MVGEVCWQRWWSNQHEWSAKCFGRLHTLEMCEGRQWQVSVEVAEQC